MKIHSLPKHLNFTVLLLILTIGIVTFYYVQPDRMLQTAVGLLTALSYIAWGVIHHVLQGDLYKKVVIEYVLIGLIVIVLFTTIVGLG